MVVLAHDSEGFSFIFVGLALAVATYAIVGGCRSANIRIPIVVAGGERLAEGA